MSVSLENRTTKVAYVRLNSGTSLAVMPGSRSAAVHESEVAGNVKLKRLEDQGLILLHRSEGEAEQQPPGDSTRGEGRKAATGTHRRSS